MALDQFFYNNPIACWVYDIHNLAFIAVNDSACAQYGYTEEEMLSGMTVLDIHPAEEKAAYQQPPTSVKSKRYFSKHINKRGETQFADVSSFDTELNGRKCRYVMAVKCEPVTAIMGLIQLINEEDWQDNTHRLVIEHLVNTAYRLNYWIPLAVKHAEGAPKKSSLTLPQMEDTVM